MKKTCIALSGAMGCGKSAAADIFKSLGANVVSADELAKNILYSDLTVRSKIIEILGTQCFQKNGEPILKEIAKVLFFNAAKLAEYEAIIHPKVLEKVKELCAASEGIFVLEIPLLFEKKLEKHFKICATVHCSEQVRLKRLEKRNLSSAEITARDAFQFTSIKKSELADVVFFNDGSLSFLKEQILIFVEKLYGRK